MKNKNRLQTEDLNSWYEAAEEWEREFVERFGSRFKVIINPSKSITETAPDLYCLNSSTSADLKPMFTPFYNARKLYGIDPNMAWTFNVSDLIDYSFTHDGKFGLFVWVKFDESEMYGVSIKQKEEIYYTTLGDLKDYLRKRKIIHKYGKRVLDERNEQASFVISLADPIFRKLEQ